MEKISKSRLDLDLDLTMLKVDSSYQLQHTTVYASFKLIDLLLLSYRVHIQADRHIRTNTNLHRQTDKRDEHSVFN